jgi:hypothetical protein
MKREPGLPAGREKGRTEENEMSGSRQKESNV